MTDKFLLKEIINIYYKKDRYKFIFLALFSLFAALLEYFGLVLIFKFALFLAEPEKSFGIIKFFNNYFNIENVSKMIFILGTLIALVYILKNIYLLVFTKFKNALLEDLSVNIALKSIKDILFQDYLISKSIGSDNKLAVIYKITIVVWQYCKVCVDLFTNCAVVFILLCYLFVKFTTAAFFALFFLSILSFVEYFYLAKKSRFLNENYSKSFDGVNSSLLKIINCTKEIKLSGRENYYINKIENDYRKFAQLNKDKNFYNVFHIYFTEISIMITFIAILGVLFFTTGFNNSLLLASISTICALTLRLTPAINRAQSALYMINSNKNIVKELIEFNNKFKKDFDYLPTLERLELHNSIKLRNVCFSYEDNCEGLKNINLEIKKGEFVAIVGKTGSYKTTLSLIISGLIKPQKGEILIDNVKLDSKNYRMWQNNISLLSQDFSLLLEDEDKINENLIDKLNLENISSKIDCLSQGQKQRLALAGVLSTEKEVLILDEISSSQDTITEDKINEILYNLKTKKTIISIAHRLTVLKHCDRVIYMDNNKIIDCGTFKELSDKYDDFRQLVNLSSFTL